jgi:hypothetical protein
VEEPLRPLGFVMSHAARVAVGYDGDRPGEFEESHD